MSVVSFSCARSLHARKVTHSRTRETPGHGRIFTLSFSIVCVRRTDCCDGGADRRRDVRQVSDVRLQFHILGE